MRNRCKFDETVKNLFQAGETMTLGFSTSPILLALALPRGALRGGGGACSERAGLEEASSNACLSRVPWELLSRPSGCMETQQGPGTSTGSSAAPTLGCAQLLQLEAFTPVLFGLLSRNSRRQVLGLGRGSRRHQSNSPPH